jgi:hypothetical protein
MLIKISNITLQNNSLKDNLPWVKPIKENSMLNSSSKDSASFSPAMSILKILEWDIDKVEYTSTNKLNLKFSIQGLEFNTSLNIDTLDTLSVFNYEVFNSEVTSEIAALFRVNLNRSGISDTLIKRKLKGLHELFQKIASFEKETTEDLFNESSVLNNLVSGIAEDINADFSFINNSLIYFLNKLLKISFSKEKIMSVSKENFFILLKVKMKRGDL